VPQAPEESEKVHKQKACSGFANTQDELAELLGITRKTITNCLRGYKTAKPPAPATRADGRYDVAAWRAFVITHNIARKAEDLAPEDLPDTGADGSPTLRTVTDWKQQKLRLECARIELENAKAEGLLVETSDVQKTTGAVVSAFRTTLNNLPGRASQKVLGLRDYHQIHAILQKEVDICLRTLEACEYLSDPPASPLRVEHITSAQDWGEVAGEKVPTPAPKKRTSVSQGKLPKAKPQRSAKRVPLNKKEKPAPSRKTKPTGHRQA